MDHPTTSRYPRCHICGNRVSPNAPGRIVDGVNSGGWQYFCDDCHEERLNWEEENKD